MKWNQGEEEKGEEYYVSFLVVINVIKYNDADVKELT